MSRLLYLVHRLPFPPNKGDKVRSYHLLKHLVQQHEVHVGTFIDDPDDEQYLPELRAMCASVCAVPLQPIRAKLRSLAALFTGEPLTLRYYHDQRLHQWVRQTLSAGTIDATLVFSSSMGQYVESTANVPVLVDLVDVDSAKWADYAHQHAWPMSWLYRREGLRLLAYERAVVSSARHSFLVTQKEVELFERLASDCRGKVDALCNGVDAEFFAPGADRVSPFEPDEQAVVFTGAMDYWPNVDAVTWFVQDMLPVLRQRWPALRFHIVGRSPTPAVRALASEAVRITGTVPDVRPYLQHAAVVVAPLRLARGVQNKVLEAMAMARPVVAANVCVAAIDAEPGRDVLTATEAGDYVDQIHQLLSAPGRAADIGRAARVCVVQGYSWPARLAGLDLALADVQRSASGGSMLNVVQRRPT